MQKYWEPLYYAFTVALTMFSAAMLWCRDRRESRSHHTELSIRLRDLRGDLNAQLIDLLYRELLPLRRMYLHLSEEDRIRSELELIFSRPEFADTIETLHDRLFKFRVLLNRLRWCKWIGILATTVALASVGGLILQEVLSRFVEYNPSYELRWISLVLAVEAVLVVLIVLTLAIRIRSQILQMTSEGAQQ